MKIAIGCDHAGFQMKVQLRDDLIEAGHEVQDLGTDSDDPIDYPEIARKAAGVIQDGQAERAILICGSGVGIGVAANKYWGVYAGSCHDTYSAYQAVEEDAINVLCLGSRVIGNDLARAVVNAFMNARFTSDDRHVRRVEQIRTIERENLRDPDE
jgi:ribose 5-phosphate isomerase B